MTPLEASTTCLFSAEDGLRERGPRRILGTQAAALSAVAVSAAQAKFGTHSLDLANTSGAGGLQFERGGPFSGSTYMSMDCWVYFRSHRASDVTRLLSSTDVSLALPSFSLRNDSSGRPFLEFRDGNNSLNPIGSASALPLNQWVHLAATYDGALCRRLYVNGSLVAAGNSVTNASISSNPSASFFIGAWNNIFYGQSPDAYIDEARFVYGCRAIETDLAAQSAAWADGASGDSLLLHGEGSDGGTTITDSSSSALTATQNGSSGNVTTSTGAARFGSASLRFGGTHSISYATSALFSIAGRDMTIECWFNADAATASLYPVIWQMGTAVGERIVLYYTPGDLTLRFDVYSGGTFRGSLAFAGIAPGNWQRAVVVKEGLVFTLWLDGVPVSSMSVAAVPSGNLNLCIGWQHYGGNSGDFFKGYVDEFRVTGGTARYTLGFTPPTAPLADIPKPEQLTPLAPFGAYQAPLYAAVGGKAAARPSFVWSEFSGKGTIGLGADPGEVLEQGTPNTPLRRRVWLMRDRDGQVIREAWSDATTGAYSFTELDETQRYTVIAFDHLHNYRAVIADNLTPEVL